MSKHCTKVIVTSSFTPCETDYKGYSAVSLEVNRFYVAPRTEIVPFLGIPRVEGFSY